MSVRLRLRREGSKKNPHYRIVAADKRSPRDGRFIEIIGTYDPQQNPSKIEVDSERALYWLRNGAQASEQVENLLTITGVWEQFKPEAAAQRAERAERRAAKAEQKAQEKAEKASQKAAAAAAEPTAETTSAPEVDETEAPAPAAETEAAPAADTDTAEDTAEGESA